MRNIVFGVALIALWFVTGYCIVSIIVGLNEFLSIRHTKAEPISLYSSKMKLALSAPNYIRPPSYEGRYRSPFRIYGGKQTVAATSAVSSYIRKQFKLKAVLIKVNPLAILEDEQGETYICRAGDILQGQKVVKITADKVILSDPKGVYEISVQEK